MDAGRRPCKLPTVKYDPIILGAGPCGLAAGLELAEHGARPLLVEREAQVGGLCRTWRHGPHAVDLSIHRLQSDEAGLAQGAGRPQRLAELFAGQLHRVPRKTIHLALEGRRLPYPLRASSLARLPRTRLARAAAEILRLRLVRPPSRGRNYREWLEEHLGKELYRWITGPLMEKQWGVPGEALDPELATTRRLSVSWADLLAGLPLVGRLFTRGIPVDFLYGRHGVGGLMELLAQRLRDRGGNLCLGHYPTTVEHRAGRITRLLLHGQTTALPVSRLVSTIPLPALVELLRPRPPAEILHIARRLRFRDMMVVALVLDRERVSRDHVTYYPERRFPFSRTFESKNASPYMSPPHSTVLGLELAVDAGDERWLAEDDDLISEMAGFGPQVGFDPKELRGGFVFRVPEAYPLYELGHRHRANQVLGWLHRHLGNLFVVGRNGLFRLDNMNHALAMGFDLGQHLLRGRGSLTWHRLLGRYAGISYID